MLNSVRCHITGSFVWHKLTTCSSDLEHGTSAVGTGAIILWPCVSGMTVVAVGRVRQRVYPVISVGHHRRLGGSRMRWTRPAGTGRIAVSVRQWQGSDGTRPALAAAAGDVLGVAGRHLLTLIPSELDGLPQFSRHGPSVTALPQKRVNCLYLVPTYKHPVFHIQITTDKQHPANRRAAVDQHRMRPVDHFPSMAYVHDFSHYKWQTAHKTSTPLIPNVFLPEHVEEENWGGTR